METIKQRKIIHNWYRYSTMIKYFKNNIETPFNSFKFFF